MNKDGGAKVCKTCGLTKDRNVFCQDAFHIGSLVSAPVMQDDKETLPNMTGKFLRGEELCIHGVGHGGVHGCDGCCIPAPVEADGEAAIELEGILINLIDKVTEGDGEPLTETEVAYKAFAKKAILAILAQEVNRARIEEVQILKGGLNGNLVGRGKDVFTLQELRAYCDTRTDEIRKAGPPQYRKIDEPQQ